MKQRAPRAKPGELKVKWGCTADEPQGDLLCAYNAVPPGASRMLLSRLHMKDYDPLTLEWKKSLLDTLEEWGFDLETLKISIMYTSDS